MFFPSSLGRIAWLLCCLAFFLAGCEQPERKELVIYSAGPRPLAELACAAFTKNTGIPTELFSATTGQILAKLEAEKYRPRADIVLLASRVAAEALRQEELLLPIEIPEIAQTHLDWHDPQGAYLSTAAAGVGIAFRENSFQPEVDWEDFLKGAYSGRAVMPSPSRSGTAGDFLLAFYQRYGSRIWPEFKEARRHGLEINGANNQALTSLQIGAHDAVMAAVDYLVFKEIERGEPLVMVFPESGSPLVHRPIAVLRSTLKPGAAREFVRAYFGEEVQQAVAAMHLIPARKDVPPSAIRQRFPLVHFLPLNPREALLEQREVLGRFQYEIERAVIVR